MAARNPRPPATDRDPKTGRFQSGNIGGPGRPPGNPLSAALRDATRARWPEIVAALLDKAVDGDIGALKLILRYAIPNPATPGQPLTGDPGADLAAMKAGLACGELDPPTAGALTRLVALELAIRKAAEGGTLTAEDVIRLIHEDDGKNRRSAGP